MIFLQPFLMIFKSFWKLTKMIIKNWTKMKIYEWSNYLHENFYLFSIKAAYSFYNVAKSQDWTELMSDALVLAKKLDFDVFNALDLMENTEFLERLKFGIGDGNLQYYLYNWRCPTLNSKEIGLVLQWIPPHNEFLLLCTIKKPDSINYQLFSPWCNSLRQFFLRSESGHEFKLFPALFFDGNSLNSWHEYGSQKKQTLVNDRVIKSTRNRKFNASWTWFIFISRHSWDFFKVECIYQESNLRTESKKNVTLQNT